LCGRDFDKGAHNKWVARHYRNLVHSSAPPEACDEVRICAASEVQPWTILLDVQEAIGCTTSPTEVRAYYLVECQARPGRE